MKNFYLLLGITLILVANKLHSQNDTLYVMKDGIAINKQCIKTTCVDSIIFYKPYTKDGCGNIQDIDGNVYPTVIIGNQCWMQTNLNVSKYRNGDIIPEVKNYTEWKNLTTGAWCYYKNVEGYGTTYGKLYNWYAVNDPRGLAPAGYHIPSDAEWTTLAYYLEGFDVAGGKMKAVGGGWWYPNTGATNSSGFRAYAGGSRMVEGDQDFQNLGYIGAFLSSTMASDTTAWHCGLIAITAEMNIINYNKSTGLSVRCLKN